MLVRFLYLGGFGFSCWLQRFGLLVSCLGGLVLGGLVCRFGGGLVTWFWDL